MEQHNPIITVKNLSVTYFPGKSNEVRALSDINLEIYPGEYIIFFGPSGCGKSTLLYSLAGLEHNITGDIFVSGLTIKEIAERKLDEDTLADRYNLRELKQTQFEDYYQNVIGMIFQAFYLIPSLSVVENVALPQVAIRAPRVSRLERALDLLNHFGLGGQAYSLPTDLSGGQQQRVAISRALMNDPAILVADEPVGNLDSTSSAEVMKVLRTLNDQQKKTVILVTHDPSHLHHAHRIFYLRDGKITGTKTNTEEERRESLVVTAAKAVTSSLTHWARTLPSVSGIGKEQQTAREQAEKVITEVFTGMTIDEMHDLFDRVEQLFTTPQHDVQPLVGFLNKSTKDGGIGMAITKAQRLADEIKDVTVEMWNLRTKAQGVPGNPQDVTEIRKTILESLGVTLKTDEAAQTMDAVIREHLLGRMDRVTAQDRLHRSIAKGGGGIEIRTARKISRRLELFALNPGSGFDDTVAVAAVEVEKKPEPRKRELKSEEKKEVNAESVVEANSSSDNLASTGAEPITDPPFKAEDLIPPVVPASPWMANVTSPSESPVSSVSLASLESMPSPMTTETPAASEPPPAPPTPQP